jgi:topoisomerase-4 subunit A
MHSLKELDDGRYNKVANVVGHTISPTRGCKYRWCNGTDWSKKLLIDCQGNWGNILTGDSAASRYEARLSKFALEVIYSPKITDWGCLMTVGERNQIIFLLNSIAFSTRGRRYCSRTFDKVLPHNFNELIDASIKY